MEDLKIITLNSENIDKEHICCAISDKKCVKGVELKKSWLKNHFSEGYIFKKYNINGKAFIEYSTGENAMMPVNAQGYLVISCLWVSGSYAGKGLGKALLNECFKDAKYKNGVAILSSNKKKPFLADKKYLLNNDFIVCDTANPYFELMVKKNNKAQSPTFKDIVKSGECENKDGLTVYYSNLCPYTEYYVNTELVEISKIYNLNLKKILIDTKEQAQNNPSPYINYSLYYNGKFLTHEIQTKIKFEKYWNLINLKNI